MTAAGRASDLEVDVAALYRAAAVLRDACAPLRDALGAASRAHGAAVAAAGEPALSAALSAFARRWDDAAGGLARRAEESATVLRAAVDAYVAADEAGVRGLAGPR